jgi:hypothetical protein
MKNTLSKAIGIASLALCLFGVALPANALSFNQLSPAQVASLRTLVDADQTAHALAVAGDDIGLAAWLNTTDASYFVWRTSVTKADVITDAAFDWTRVDNLTVGKARIWTELFSVNGGAIDPSRANVRAGIDAAWVGTAADLAVRASVYGVCKRNASRAEKAVATGTGTSAVPATLVYEGQITYAEASQIRS